MSSPVRSIGRALRRGLALLGLGAIRGRRVLAPVAGVLLVALAVLAYVTSAGSPAATARATRPAPARAPAGAQPPTGTGPAAPVSGATAAPGSAEAAIQQAIQTGDEAQARAIASGDPTVMRGSSTDAYYDQSVRGNQDLVAGGVTGIHLDRIEWGQITVSGDVATATADETWTTEYADGTTEQSRDRNVYGLVRQSGV